MLPCTPCLQFVYHYNNSGCKYVVLSVAGKMKEVQKGDEMEEWEGPDQEK